MRRRRERETLWAAQVLGPSGLLPPLIKSDCLVMIPLGVPRWFKREEVRVQFSAGPDSFRYADHNYNAW